MIAAMVSLVVTAAPMTWDGRSPIEVSVGDSVTVELPRLVRFVSVGAGDVLDLGVSRDLRSVHLRGLRRGTRTVTAHFQDRTRAVLEIKVLTTNAGRPARRR
jgi:Flp pilus assembly secretin CpaC